MSVSWEKLTEDKFNRLIEKVPVFMRGIAKDKVAQKAESIVKEANREEICEKDMVDAFFAETPFGFQGPLKCDMEELGIDYTQYGYDR